MGARRYGPLPGRACQLCRAIFEQDPDRVVAVDIEPYGDGAGEMATIWVTVNGEQVDWFPKLGPWERSERHAEALIRALD